VSSLYEVQPFWAFPEPNLKKKKKKALPEDLSKMPIV
jgi:hypothetical protein